MKTPLAWTNLTYQPLRTLVAVAGVAFAAILILLQFGSSGAVESPATLLYDRLDYDLLITSREYLDLNRSRTFTRERLAMIQSDPEVASVRPLYVGFNMWRSRSEFEAAAATRDP